MQNESQHKEYGAIQFNTHDKLNVKRLWHVVSKKPEYHKVAQAKHNQNTK